MKAALREWVSRSAGVLGLRRADADMEQELQTHLRLAEDDLLGQGMSAIEAAREARRRYGHPTQTMEALRDQSAFPHVSAFWLDVKLGLRMLRKHWSLTLVGGFVLTLAITVGASFFGFVQTISGNSLPLNEGDRVVVIQPWDAARQVSQGSSVEDYQRWRESLRSVVDIGAFRTSRHNLAVGSGPADPVPIAEMSAGGFRVARVRPQLGNVFTDADERPGAPAVVVIGHNVWRTQFAANRDIVGQFVKLDGVAHTIIGVMPPGFAFPVNHEFWRPLNSRKPGDVTVFGRIAPGASLEGAQAEVKSAGLVAPTIGTAGPQPQSRVVPYIVGISGTRSPLLSLLPLLFSLLLVPPCLNIAVLVYARTVARQAEFAARMALGASRGRIVAQVFTEVLLLTLGAAGVAVALASKGTDVLNSMVPFNRAFWMTFDISYQTILFILALAVFAAIIAGGFPALRVTRRWQLSGLHSLNRSTAPRLGKAWTAAVVLQVALSMAIVPTIAEFTWVNVLPVIEGPGFKAEEYLTARLSLDPKAGPDAAARFVNLRGEMAQRLRAEPGVTAATLSKTAPFEEEGVSIDVKSESPEGRLQQRVSFNDVDDAFFDAFDVRMLTGRGFESGDADPARGSIVVNQSFAQQILGSRNPLGSRVRVIGSNDDRSASATSGEYEIVGVVSDVFTKQPVPTIYRPILRANEPASRVHMTLHLSPAASTTIGTRLRQIANGLDPSLQVDDLQTLAEIHWFSSLPGFIVAVGIAGVVLGLVLFAVAGIYTLMAFAVVQRRREIGIRSALGASPIRLVVGVCRRVLLPVCAGAVLGGVAAVLASYFVSPLLFDESGSRQVMPWLLPAAEACVLSIGALAVVGPARRALAIDVSEAIRND
jgi:putative ABC transport system permease protein